MAITALKPVETGYFGSETELAEALNGNRQLLKLKITGSNYAIACFFSGCQISQHRRIVTRAMLPRCISSAHSCSWEMVESLVCGLMDYVTCSKILVTLCIRRVQP